MRVIRVLRAYKTELALNHSQITACKRHAGAARWAYNWGLRRKQEAYAATGKAPTAIELHRELTALKQIDVPWMYAVSKCAPQEALRNLDAAFAHFFRRCLQRKTGKWSGKVGYPQPKSKKKGLGSFRLNGSIVVFSDVIQLPRLGRVRLKEREYLPVTPTSGVKLFSATVSEQSGRWYVSIQVEQEQSVPDNTGPVVGVDLGIKALATLSDGTVIPNPKRLKRALKKIKRLHKAVTRKEKGGNNRKKAARKVGKQYQRIAHQRANTLHQVTTRLAKTKSVIVIEDLHVAGMLRNHHLAQAIADAGFAEFRRQLTYKAAWYGARVVVVSRWEPTSKRCSQCGWLDTDLTLADRVFCCEACGLTLDRDLNAALNLRKLAASSADSQNACGEDRSGRRSEDDGETVPGEAGTKHVEVPCGLMR